MNRLPALNRIFVLILFTLVSLVAGCGQEPSNASETIPATTSESATAAANKPADVIARVGSEHITFTQIDVMLNSSPIRGMPAPALGTPERQTARLSLLDKVISANLLYLDALQNGADKEPEYQQAIEKFSDGLLAELYREKNLIGDIQVTEDEVKDYYATFIDPTVELTEEVKTGIEASIRKKRYQDQVNRQRKQLREGVDVEIVVTELNPDEDEIRDNSVVVATIDDDEQITWGQVKTTLVRPQTPTAEQRIEPLDRFIDSRIMARKARDTKLMEEPAYRGSMNEFRKTRLINFHRGRLIDNWQPTDEQLKAFYEENLDKIAVREVREVQMVLLNSEEQARELKKKIEAGDLTFHEAAAKYSITPDAEKTLGKIGWVSKGTGFPELDEVTFFLDPDEIGGPVKSPAGWHLVRVLDKRDAQFVDFDNEFTRKRTKRMYLHGKLDEYVINLRQNVFPVEIYQDEFKRLVEQEAATLNAMRKAAEAEVAAAKAKSAEDGKQ